MIKIVALLPLLIAMHARAEFTAGLGIYQHNLNRVTSSEGSKKDFLGTRYLPVTLRYVSESFGEDFRFSPYFATTHLTSLVYKEANDENYTRDFFLLGLPIEYQIGERWFLSGGPGLMIYQIGGKGGTRVVNNGTGTSTFGKPSKTRNLMLSTLELGADWQLENWRIGADLVLTGFLSERFASSLHISFAYRFGGGGI